VIGLCAVWKGGDFLFVGVSRETIIEQMAWRLEMEVGRGKEGLSRDL
jgi:hypothetical protein